MDYDLRLLEGFVVLAEELHFGRAAERLSMAQPALSQQVRRLEEQLGVILFTRDTRRVELSEAGAAFLPSARAALTAATHAGAAARAAGAGARGLVRLGIDVDVPQGMRTELQRMHDSHPGVEVRATVKDYPDAIANLRAGELDAVLGWSGPFDDDLAWQVVRSFPFCAAMRDDHPEAGRSSVDRQRLGTYPVALFARANGPEAYDFITDAIRPQDADVEVVVVPNIADSIGAMLDRVQRDAQTVTVTFAAAMEERPTDGLRLVALDPPLVLDLLMIWLPRHDPPPLQLVRSLLTRQK